MRAYLKDVEYTTGIQREFKKSNRKFDAKTLGKFFGLSENGARKKITTNSFSVEEAIALMTAFYDAKDLTFEKLIELFTFKKEI
jgi:hypothetical protein